jgi:hypothetical protein
MRYKLFDNRKDGDERIVNRFLLIPKRIGNEIRWFERVSFKQIRRRFMDTTSGSEWFQWVDENWVK